MTVLHLLYSERLSGAESVVCHIIRTMEPEHRMIYASPAGPIADALAERSVSYVPLKKLSVREVRRVVREQGIDLIHAHDMRASYIACKAVPDMPLVFHIHNNATEGRRLSLKSMVFRHAARRAQHIFWVSESAKNDYRFARALRKKSSVLENVVDPARLMARALEENAPFYDVLFLGRLTAVKDPLRFVGLMRRVADAYPSLRCAMIGAGDMEELVRIRVQALKLEENIDLLGFCTNPYPYLSRARMMVMTSVYEGMPIAALEALSFGVPIVATPVDGLVSLLGKGEGGVLSADDGELCDAILQLLTDDDVLVARRTEAKAVAEAHNDVEAYRARIEAVYADALRAVQTKGGR